MPFTLRGTERSRAWRSAFADLEARGLDVAVIPSDQVPPRFHAQRLCDEDFVIAARARHPFAKHPSLERFCEAEHLVVSSTGDARGFVDERLAEHGLSRRVMLTIPNFMFALAIIAETDLICALPRRFAAMHAARFGVVAVDAPLELARFRLTAVAPRVAMMDAGLAWIFDLLARTPLA